MKRTNLIWGKLLLCFCEVLTGIILLINPIGFTSGIITALGIVITVIGLFSIIRYLRTDPAEAIAGQGLMKGLCAILAGLFCVLKSEWFLSVFPILTVIYGIVILITGIARIQWTIDMLRMKQGKWYLAALGAIVALLCGMIIIANPFDTAKIIWIFTGISLIAEAVIDLLIAVLIYFEGKNSGKPE